MQEHFYSSVIEVDSFIILLDTLKIPKKEKEHLTALVHSTIHTTILDLVLSEIPVEDKKLFLRHLHANDHQKIWKFLHTRTINIEDKMYKAVKDLLREFSKDIEEVQDK